MKKFKIFSLAAIFVGGLFLLSGCGQKELTGSLEDIMNDLNEYGYEFETVEEEIKLKDVILAEKSYTLSKLSIGFVFSAWLSPVLFPYLLS